MPIISTIKAEVTADIMCEYCHYAHTVTATTEIITPDMLMQEIDIMIDEACEGWVGNVCPEHAFQHRAELTKQYNSEY